MLVFMVVMLFLAMYLIFVITSDISKDKEIASEFNKIEIGDIYERDVVNEYGISPMDPYKNFKYKVLSKQLGWVTLEDISSVDAQKEPTTSMSVANLINRGYKCINRK